MAAAMIARRRRFFSPEPPVFSSTPRPPAQSLTYTKGQNISPANEGWEQAPDGNGFSIGGAAQRPNRSTMPPSRLTVGKSVGLHVSWFMYRGPSGATVTFDPPLVKAWEDTRTGANSPWAPIWGAPPMPADGKSPVNATFSEPGTYLLRCLTDDGALTGSDDVTIVVVR